MGFSSSEETHTNHIHTIDSHNNESQTTEWKKKRKQRGVTMMTRLTKVHNSGDELLVDFNPGTWTCYGENSSLFKSYVVFLRHIKVSILIDDWA